VHPARIYYYILSYDGGIAPCVDNGVLTLAICKPGIRRNAKKGDWLIGFSPKETGWKLSYLAKVSNKLQGKEYYGSGRFDGRTDCIYKLDSNEGFILRSPRIHNSSKNKTRDVGTSADNYQNAWVLKSDEFWYFGGKAMNVLGPQTSSLIEKLGKLSQGHRVNHSPRVREELEGLVEGVRRKYEAGVHGSPRDSSDRVDDQSDDYGSCL
jgi:putative DNA base modification enzyme with NMAD domain